MGMCRMRQQNSPRLAQPREALVETPEAVAAMLRPHEVGWGTRRIALGPRCLILGHRCLTLPTHGRQGGPVRMK